MVTAKALSKNVIPLVQIALFSLDTGTLFLWLVFLKFRLI